ncbi:MAG: hypothetical protein A3I78_07980 [Gammaproteobacteria bacterium RIFCSPLOWO2_02_FULL_56_15]|nr:MAG: hypothetical protein A3I78_07980 [Gammaproteobacteria bacterium RIFCSPLOWO2_02_FULL_56_15]
MAAENQVSPDTGPQTIQPVSVNLTTQLGATGNKVPGKLQYRQLLVGLGLLFLLASALAVIFLLPGWSPFPPVIEKAGTGSVAETAPPVPAQVPATPRIGESPWEKAIQSALRKETQELLAKLLEARQSLEEHGVVHWAGKDYETGSVHARNGDELYNQGDFTGARNEYQEALGIFTGLVTRIETVFDETLAKGLQALTDGDSVTAKEVFQLALAIDALDRDAIAGMQRAGVLDEVLAQLRKGDDLLDSNQPDEAAEVYQQALVLDGESVPAREKLEIASDRIRGRKFARLMSAGFSALEMNRLEQARTSFNEALRIRPQSTEAHSALQQTGQKITSSRIHDLLERARVSEQEERWEDALSAYREAVGIDATLAEAQSGESRTGLRVQVHDQLEQLIRDPQRLYDPAVLQETLAFFKRINDLSSKGPVLERQLEQVSLLLDKANTPVLVRLQSDNQTDVTLYRVGKLGYFENMELFVKPGKYIAVGQRDGYQDVREEFLVKVDQPVPVIRIQADKEISAVQ